MSADNEQPGSQPTSQQELLRQWEERIVEADGDPMAALADLLGARHEARNRLFGMAGQVVLGHRLGGILGAGGMGVTYDGVDGNGERVAVKLVPGVAEAARPRFEQECRLLAEMQHPAIVRYRAHGLLEDGTGALVMDLVRGCDFERILLALSTTDPHASGLPVVDAMLSGIDERGAALRISARFRRRVMRILADVAAGLHVAHELGIVHRDVKPANILVRDDLSPVLIDFGLARDQQNRVSFTQSGIAMGTLAYMAPEQFGDDPGAVDRRADIYAVGLLLYRAMFGADFRTEVDDVLKRRRRAFLLDSRQSRELSTEVQAILYGCLDPRPERRYATCRELEEDLRAAAGQGVVKARVPSLPARVMRDRRAVAVGTALAAALVAVLAFLAWPRGREVLFLANCGLLDAVAVVDGETTVSLGDPCWLPLGVHEVELRGAAVRPSKRTFAVDEGQGASWITLTTTMPGSNPELTRRVPEGRSMVAWSSGHQWNPIDVGLPRDRLEIDGSEVSSSVPGENTELLPGRHTMVATDGRGRVETQTVDVRDPAVDVHMLPAVLSDRDGSFRRTWSCVHSPLPSEFQVESDAILWSGLAKKPVIPLNLMAMPCAFAPGNADADARVVVRCRFPQPMRTAFVYLRASCAEGATLRVEAALEGEAPQQLLPDAAGVWASVATLRSANGATSLTVTARMRSRSAPNVNVALVKFLEGMAFGGHWQDDPPCFAVVADPASQVGRLDAPSMSAPSEVRRLQAERVLVEPALGSEPLLAGSHVSDDGLRIAWTALDGPRRVLFDASLDGFPARRRLEATAMHARVDADDGINFGVSLVYVPDLDGDGVAERVVSDMSSTVRGRRFAGLVACFDSRDDRLRWLWPRFAAEGKHGDESARVWGRLVGDWNGDGFPDLVAIASRTNPSNGAHKAGHVAVLDSTNGEEIWASIGVFPWEARSVGATLERGLSFRSLLLWRHVNTTEAEYSDASQWLWVTGLRGQSALWGSVLPAVSAAALISDTPDGDGPGAVVHAVLQPTATGFVGLERHELVDNRCRLSARRKFHDGLPIANAIVGLHRLADVDQDGVEDMVMVLTARVRNGVPSTSELERVGSGPWSFLGVVSGRSLDWLAFVEFPGVLFSMLNYLDLPVWAPDKAGGGDLYVLCSSPPAPLTERELFRIPIRLPR